jgi:hypothetical protein
LILAVAAAKCPDVFWGIAGLEDPRQASSGDLKALKDAVEEMNILFGYYGADKPTMLCDPIENAIGYLNGLID